MRMRGSAAAPRMSPLRHPILSPSLGWWGDARAEQWGSSPCGVCWPTGATGASPVLRPCTSPQLQGPGGSSSVCLGILHCWEVAGKSRVQPPRAPLLE